MWKCVLLAALSTLAGLGQQPENTPAFEVASVKANPSFAGPSAISGATPGRFTASNTPLRFVILYAYRLLDNQLTGAPEWTASDSFDIVATYPPGPAPTDEDVRGMVRQLLSEHFGLRVHREQKEQPMYSLIVAGKPGRLGPQLRRSDLDCDQPAAAKQPKCGMVATRRSLKGGTRTLAQLAVTLQSMVAWPVIDRTGLTGAFDMDLQWDDTQGPSIFTALQEQLGLKLETGQARFETLIVDRIEKPTSN